MLRVAGIAFDAQVEAERNDHPQCMSEKKMSSTVVVPAYKEAPLYYSSTSDIQVDICNHHCVTNQFNPAQDSGNLNASVALFPSYSVSLSPGLSLSGESSERPSPGWPT